MGENDLSQDEFIALRQGNLHFSQYINLKKQ